MYISKVIFSQFVGIFRHFPRHFFEKYEKSTLIIILYSSIMVMISPNIQSRINTVMEYYCDDTNRKQVKKVKELECYMLLAKLS